MKAFIHRTWETRLKHFVSFPFIYAPFIAFVVLDFIVEIYHHICFPLYKIPKVNRWDYILIDRHHLSYLNFSKKFNCVYCGYINGLLQYWVKIVGDTEEYWCGIQHEWEDKKLLQAHHKDFAKYGDEADLQARYFA